MRLKRFFLHVPIIVLLAVACQDPYNHELDKSKLDFLYNDTPAPTELDNWLFENFTLPYNIEVKYRFQAGELNINRMLVPPAPDKVPIIMNVVNEAWIKPYLEEAGETFFKAYCPKQFVLVGSPEYNPGGTITLGTAEGGRKVVLYVINEFDDTDRVKIKEQLHTIHHEFAHILHQNITYPASFREITPGAYTADWNNISTSVAQSRGFISPYSMSSPNEDFVEIIATMLTEGKRGYDRIVCSIPSSEAQELLRRKEDMIVNYFSQAYNIDFYELQQKTDAAIDQFVPKKLLADLGFQSGQSFNSIVINPAQLPPLPSEFMTLYDACVAGVPTVDEGQFVLDEVRLVFDGAGYSALRFVIRDTSDPDQFQYFADYYYIVSEDQNGIVTFTYDDQNSNADFIDGSVDALVDYIENNTFEFDWILNEADGCIYDFGGIYPQETPDAFAFGFLSN